jgi:hypothetical protein
MPRQVIALRVKSVRERWMACAGFDKWRMVEYIEEEECNE